jgi:RNA polymerase sigma-70 factor (ECF subfamily)
MPCAPDFEELVSLYYEPLYQFALSLAHNEADAADLTQQTFWIWAAKGSQLREPGKAKTWLFTTLHREFLNSRRRLARFPHLELGEAEPHLPPVSPETIERLDGDVVLAALSRLDESFRAPVALFYLQDCSYQEIAEVLEVPVGTVKSRLARGLARLERLLTASTAGKGRAKGPSE